ncbi:ribosome small subunit-dependent GTPase A [Alkalibaculum sp. M08DMB]|uniref:Small ribosomal subunit biogenesis GTPase RsgA n=1 Tax=Alkalibaculum sporogenes TaxID=2655001 RepID=A0A6A7KA29_9FIRM|nr:ribosome small subunit-dependent GTPase A [Alkalibaculum sporogenes]
MNGIIIKGIGGFYYVKSGKDIHECKPRGLFRKNKFKPLPGDYVELELDGTNIGTITKVYPRKNYLIRPPISNITQNIVVSAMIHPQINYGFLNKILVYAETMDIVNVLCFNKVDLATIEAQMEIESAFKNTGYKTIFTSTVDDSGIEDLKQVLKNNVNVFSGASGVGKSSILNRVIPNLQVEIGELSRKIERGKHTTRQVELFEIDEDTFIADTPGFSNIDVLENIEVEELMNYFPDFSSYLGKCKYNSCIHHKEPGCAVKEAVLNDEISKIRYDSYIEIISQIKDTRKY